MDISFNPPPIDSGCWPKLWDWVASGLPAGAELYRFCFCEDQRPRCLEIQILVRQQVGLGIAQVSNVELTVALPQGYQIVRLPSLDRDVFKIHGEAHYLVRTRSAIAIRRLRAQREPIDWALWRIVKDHLTD